MKKITIILILLSNDILACSCHHPIETNGELTYDIINYCDLIVNGEVVFTSEKFDSANFYYTQTIKIRPIKIYKGKHDTLYTIINNDYGSSCDFGFKKGMKAFFLISSDSTGSLHYEPCLGTFRYENEEQIKKNKHTVSTLERFSKLDKVKLKYSNGKLMANGNLISQRPEGYWEFYDYLGNIYMKGNYKNGKKHGEWTVYIPDYDNFVIDKSNRLKKIKYSSKEVSIYNENRQIGKTKIEDF